MSLRSPKVQQGSLPSGSVDISGQIVDVYEFRWTIQNSGSWTEWQVYTPGSFTLPWSNPTSSPRTYILERRVTGYYGSIVVRGPTISRNTSTFPASPSLSISDFSVSPPGPIQEGVASVTFAVYQIGGATPYTITAATYVLKDFTGSSVNTGSLSSLTDNLDGTWTGQLTVPSSVVPPGGFGDLDVSVTATPSGTTTVAAATEMHTFPGYWDIQDLALDPGQYLLPPWPSGESINSWGFSTDFDIGWAVVAVGAGEDTSQVRLRLNGEVDQYPSELTVYMQSPLGTIESWDFFTVAGFSDEFFTFDFITTAFTGEASAGNWKVWFEDDASDGGMQQTGGSFIQFEAYVPPPGTFPLPTFPGGSWTSSTLSNLSWASVTVGAGEDTAGIYLDLQGFINQTSSITIEITSPSSTVHTFALSDYEIGSFLSVDVSMGTSAFAAEPTAGTWTVDVKDSFSAGGASSLSGTLRFTNTTPPTEYIVPSFDSVGVFSTSDWVSDMTAEFGWTSVVIPPSQDTSSVSIRLEGDCDEYASELTVELESPLGTVHTFDMTSIVADGSSTSFSETFPPTSAFNGEGSGGTWLLNVLDSFGDGGLYVSSCKLLFNA